ncbi:MAG: type II secretion system F family protein [bacterium]|nr:type II secretion system F family protein [bacterium]MCM1374367.1 type II secretion system F family protein [Muribaculum sp.]
MASYGYEAIDAAGKTVKGSIEAENIDKARSDLKTQGMTILNLKEQSLLTKDLNFEIGGKPKPRDLSVFCRQFVSMIRAGVTILEALRMLTEATENKKLKQAIDEVRISAEKGEALASAIAEHPKVFPDLMVNMVAAGEASGSLDKSMERMAVQFERASKTRALVKKAMTYPIVVVFVAIVVVIIMLVKVIPSYVTMFEDLDAELPGITLAVMAASDFLIDNGLFILPCVVGLFVLLMRYKRTDSGKHFFGKAAMVFKPVKNMVVKSASAQMARTLSTLLGSGVPMVEAVGIVSQTMTNVYFKEALEEAKNDIIIGQPLSVPLQRCGLFPPMVYHMIRIGEESGNTEEMLDRLADYYEEEVEMAVQTLMAAMEPMIIVVLAGVVGVLIGACMAPMVSMYDALDNL